MVDSSRQRIFAPRTTSADSIPAGCHYPRPPRSAGIQHDQAESGQPQVPESCWINGRTANTHGPADKHGPADILPIIHF